MKHTLLILVTLCSTSAFAQSPVPVINNADIDSSGSRYQGNLSGKAEHILADCELFCIHWGSLILDSYPVD